MKILDKKLFGAKYPPLIVHIYYFIISVTFSYLYGVKFLPSADFYSPLSTGGIFAVLNGTAVKPVQFRILIPLIFKALSIFSFLNYKILFVIISVVLTYFILISFYALLNCYFKDKIVNSWLPPVIIYPMVWNYILLNGQFFFMDFSVLLFIILGSYFILKEKNISLLILFFLGTLNHPSVGYLIIAFALFNYKKFFKFKTIIYGGAMAIIYIVVYKVMDKIYPGDQGYFILYNLPYNLSLFHILSPLRLLKIGALNFGALHIFFLFFFLSGRWKKFNGPKMYINLTLIPYIVSVWLMFSIHEIRNYIAIIPFFLIPCLMYLSTLENSLLKPVDEPVKSSSEPK